MQVSYYNETYDFLFNTKQNNSITYSYTEVLYLGNFLKPKFSTVSNQWIESATQEEIEQYEESLPTLASEYANQNNFTHFDRDIDVPIDILEFFKSKEKVYNLKGEPVIKSYVYLDNTPICDIIYEKQFENKVEEGFTKNEFVSSNTIFRFYKKADKSLFKDKVIHSLPFNLVPTVIRDENNNVTDVLWSSVKREEVLRNERYKSEEVMKTFNPMLYKLFTQVFGDAWQRYKETGDKTQLVLELNNAPHVLIATGVYLDEKLQEQVSDEDKIVLGLLPTDSLTILELILDSLQ